MSAKIRIRRHDDDIDVYVVELYSTHLLHLDEPIDHVEVRYDATPLQALHAVQELLHNNRRKL